MARGRAACLLAIALTFTCAASELKRSGYLAPVRSPVQPVHWLDNDSVLFVGAKPGIHHTTEDGRRPLKNFLVEWDTNSGSAKVLGELGEGAEICHANGYVRYEFQERGQWKVRRGPLGKESPQEAWDGRGKRINPFTCREYDIAALRDELPGGFWPLREEHGFWGARADGDPSRSVLLPPDKARSRERAVNIPYEPPPGWSDYSSSYFFARQERVFSSTKTTGKMWVMKPGGEVQEVSISAGPWFRGSAGYGIAKPGILMWSAATGLYTNEDAGMYLVTSGRPQRFVEGYVLAFGVSPDGCKVALSLVPRPGPRDTAGMVMANLCAGNARAGN